MTTETIEETAPAETPAATPAPRTTTALAVRSETHTLPAKLQYAQELANSGLLPKAFRFQPANVLFAIEYGEMLGLPPVAAMMGIYVIDGKPAAYASLISALVRKAHHRLRVGFDEQKMTGWAEIVRCDDPDFTFRSEWSLDRAVTAELCTLKNGLPHATDKDGKTKPWKKYFPSMTKARAVTEVARDACEEALFGLHYTPEELGAEVDDEGHVVGGTIVADTPAATQVPSDDTWYVRPPAAAAAENDWLKQAEEQASSFTTQEEGKKLWAEVMARWESGQIRTEDSDRLSALMKARRAVLAEAAAAPSAQPADDAEVVDAVLVPDGLDPSDPWAASVESIANQEDADAAMADAGKQLEAGHLAQDKYDLVVTAISQRLDTLSREAAA